MQGEMPGFPFPGRPGGEHDEPLLDMIIARRALPPDAPQPMHDLARMLAALAGPAEPGELTGEAAVRAAFRQAVAPAGISPAARRPGRRRKTRRAQRPARSRARLATALVAAVVGLGSVLAAYTDVLPSPIQQLAHVTVAAPAPPHSGRPATSAPGHAKARQVHATSGPPARGPLHSAGSAQPPGQASSAQAHYRPPASPSGRRPTEPACGPAPWRSTGPPDDHVAPSGSQGEQCTGIPTRPASEPTLNPYVPNRP
jgi:hypothetical protein